jgi:hypothetical protein
MPASGTQIVYIVVQDQNLRPVEDVQVTVAVRLPTGEEGPLCYPANEHGWPHCLCDPGAAGWDCRDFVFVNSNDLEDRTRTSFRIWW